MPTLVDHDDESTDALVKQVANAKVDGLGGIDKPEVIHGAARRKPTDIAVHYADESDRHSLHHFDVVRVEQRLARASNYDVRRDLANPSGRKAALGIASTTGEVEKALDTPVQLVVPWGVDHQTHGLSGVNRGLLVEQGRLRRACSKEITGADDERMWRSGSSGLDMGCQIGGTTDGPSIDLVARS
jgi:hypothetical protein